MRSQPLHTLCRSARVMHALVGIAVIAGLVACSNSKEMADQTRAQSRAYQPAPAWNPGNRPVSEALPIGDYSTATQPTLIGTQRLHAGEGGENVSMIPGSSSAGVGVLDSEPGRLFRVKYAANGANAQEVLRVLISEFLQRPFVLDPKVTGEVTLDVDQEMTPSDVMDLVSGLCTLYGWYVEDQMGTVYVRAANTPSGSIARGPAPILTTRAAVDSGAPAVRVRTLRYITPETLKTVLQPLMTDGAQIAIAGRTLVMVDTVKQLNKISRLLAALDVPAFDGVSVWTYRLATKTPEEAAKLLDAIASGSKLGGAGAGGGEPLVVFVPISGTNRLMVISRDESVQSIVQSFIQQVDRADSTGQKFRYVYNIQHYESPEKLVALLKDFFSERVDNSAPLQPGQTAPRGPVGAKIVYDAEEQRLLIQATPEDYADIIATLRVLDRPRQQVQVDAIVAEVGLNGSLKFGVEYFLRAFDQKGFGILELAGTPGLPTPASGAAFFVGGDGLAIIQALDTQSDVQILSQPRMTLVDRVKGGIQVGGKTPTVTSDLNSDAGTSETTAIRRDIRYQDTGIIFEATPSICESGDVKLAIRLEINEVGTETDLGPEFTTRKLETTVIVPHGKTLVMGGLVSTIKRNTKTKIPGLGDIPVAGVAFTTTENRDIRTELMLTITPKIMNSPEEAGQTVGAFLMGAHGVRAALETDFEDLPQGMMHDANAVENGMTPLLEPQSSELVPLPASTPVPPAPEGTGVPGTPGAPELMPSEPAQASGS